MRPHLSNYPNENSIKKWLCTNLHALFRVQDMVHVAVKFKTRLLKPSILLPMGDYIATSAHLHILRHIYGKEKHGMRRRDLDSRDKQNFAAIEHLMSASTLLENIPDALGTKVYLEIVNASVNSYLDKSCSPKKRINDIWYAVFFLRYWREWIHQHRAFTIRDNFITSNCYTCVEINAHSLLAYVISMRDIYKAPECFTPWQMGSQNAEKIFRSLRSMQGTFSTIVNFTLLGMLQRLHKLAIKEDLESESERESHGIHLARLEGHKKKTGHGEVRHFDWDLADEDIFFALKQAEERAKSAISTLGMADELKRVNKWEIPPKPSNIMNTWNDNDDDDEKEEYGIEEDGINEAEDLKDIVSDLEKLHANNAIESARLKKGQSMARKARKVNIDIPSVGIPTYQNVTTEQESNNSLFVPVVVEGRSIFIRKKTAVWLLNDGERVSSDRIFRVRSKQPNESKETIKLSTIMSDPVENKPIVSNHVVIGDFCVFYDGTVPKIGKVLQFLKYDIKGKKINYRANYATVGDNFKLLCTWYTIDTKSRQCHMTTTENMYIPIDYYKFTLTMECIENLVQDKELGFIPTLLSLTNEFKVTPECMKYIDSACDKSTLISLMSSHHQLLVQPQTL